MKNALRARANAVHAGKVYQRTLTLLETYQSDYYQKKEEKWTREWALVEAARQQGFYSIGGQHCWCTRTLCGPNASTCAQKCVASTRTEARRRSIDLATLEA
jgi:hypothetical protein